MANTIPGKLTSFNPKIHGFSFSNSDYSSTVWFEQIKIQTEGRCGGMAYSALDYFYNQIPIPDGDLVIPSDSIVPPDGTVLGNYIYERLMASFHNVWQPLTQRVLPSPTNWYGKGIKGGDNFEELKREVNNGRPKPMVLVSMKSSLPGIVDIGSCHQVCAIGYYEGSRDLEDIRIYLYDPNHPGKWTYIRPNRNKCLFEELAIDDDGNDYAVGTWRNYFVDLRYKVQLPPNTSSGSESIVWSNTVHAGEDLNGRNFRSYILTGANFEGAKMRSCDLARVDARRAIFSRANITHSTLSQMKLEGAQFEGADLRSSTLNGLLASKKVSFMGANLGNVKFVKAECRESNFIKTALQGAVFDDSKLDDSKFSQSVGNRTSFQRASLQRARFDSCNFVSSFFTSAKMQGVNFSNTLTNEVDFSQCDASSAKFCQANLKAARFESATLTTADFKQAALHGAIFVKANAKNANFSGSNLHSADFRLADLQNADFSNALLHNADFTGARLDGCKWRGAITVNTKLPQSILNLIARGG